MGSSEECLFLSLDLSGKCFLFIEFFASFLFKFNGWVWPNSLLFSINFSLLLFCFLLIIGKHLSNFFISFLQFISIPSDNMLSFFSILFFEFFTLILFGFFHPCFEFSNF